ncbi:hypothetical protein MWU57_16445 [Isoptericola sp. S6320L]|uniref:AMIN-like domain-containing (lipo)protein n=1 Tax=Isoptericola sp. S6320L TaxID=2926411 RepID=UPI001FF3CA1C|nr:hypothetical protein [Isoptericola sp. S6320L]MCK0118617.1 hypothetical protein [Isoptericola sp. S6320L]
MRATQHRRAGRGAAAAVALALTVAGCGGGADLPGYGGGGGAATETTTPSESTPEPSDDAGTATPEASPDASPEDGGGTFEGGTAVATGEPGGDQLLTVTDVAVEPQDGFDRVTFTLDGSGTPGWRVEYVDEALDPGKGDPVEVDGDAVLQVVILGTAMPMDSGVEEYDGTPVEPDDAESVEEVVYRFVFEGQTTAFVGVDGEPKPFAVSVEEDPTRLVVDVGH